MLQIPKLLSFFAIDLIYSIVCYTNTLKSFIRFML